MSVIINWPLIDDDPRISCLKCLGSGIFVSFLAGPGSEMKCTVQVPKSIAQGVLIIMTPKAPVDVP